MNNFEQTLINKLESKLDVYKEDLVIMATGSWGIQDLGSQSDLDLIVLLKDDLLARKNFYHDLLLSLNYGDLKFDENFSPKSKNGIFTLKEWTERINDPLVSNRLICLSLSLKSRFLFGNLNLFTLARKTISLEARELKLKDLSIQSLRQIWASERSDSEISKVYLSHLFLKEVLITNNELLLGDYETLKKTYDFIKNDVLLLKEKSKLDLVKMIIRDLLRY